MWVNGERWFSGGESSFGVLTGLINCSVSRNKYMRGVLPRGFVVKGNKALGDAYQSIFPEVGLDKNKRNIGFDVTIVTTARTDEEAKSLLSEMGMPFSDRPKKPVAAETA